jgi:uroporphyrinogen decarboxylase
MALSDRENYIRNVHMTGPEWMPCALGISGGSWDQWREDLEEVAARHPLFFPSFRKGQRDWDHWDFGPGHRAGERYTDAWGCVWYSDINGIEGVVVDHPLADWEALATYQPPDAMTQLDRAPVDWEQVRAGVARARANGHLTSGGLAHGFLLMRMYYLRGFENLMLDFATENPRLDDLIALVSRHNRVIVDQYVAMGVDMVDFGEDIGTQTASLISPKHFHQYIMPAYQSLMQPCRDAGIIVGSHSDGYIMELIDDLLAAGLNIVNPQDLCNGVDNLAREVKGRVCIKLDVDRQTVVPFGSPGDIHDLIEEEVRKLGSPQGGLELVCGIYPPTPPENVDAVCSAMEEFRTWWWDGRAR